MLLIPKVYQPRSLFSSHLVVCLLTSCQPGLSREEFRPAFLPKKNASLL